MNWKKRFIIGLIGALAFTGISTTANASPASAMTINTNDCYRQWVTLPYIPGQPYRSAKNLNEYCKYDYSWWEEVQGYYDRYGFYRTVSKVLYY